MPIDTLAIGIKSNYSKPNAGTTSPNDPGNCTFLSYDVGARYIYHYTKATVYDTFYAQNNYYGGTPQMTRFYWNSANSPVIYSPWLSFPPAAPRMESPGELPLAFELRQNYPNPFNPTTTISFTLDEPGYTTLTIYNLLGQRITWVADEYMEGGEHSAVWNGRNDSGEAVASGIYFYILRSGENVHSQKMTLLR